MLGKKINGFELIRLLGVGGMAEVWYAENEIHKPAAVKVLNPELSRNASIVERFRNEAEIMVRLDHHNIRQVYGYGLIDERPAIVMEYLNGADLAARMNQGQRFTNEELIKWWNQLVDALQYTHEEGIVHRDIKPANIFVDNRGNIKLLDFGIAKIRESISLTHTGTFMGTLLYMSPEQIKDSKHIDYHTDIYSLAVTFVHLLTGQKPYDETTTSNFDIQLSIVTKPLDLSGVPEQWRVFLEPYLNKEADQRPNLRFFDATQPVTPVSPKPTTLNRPIETPISAGKTTINEKPYNINEIHKENEPKKTFLGYDKKEWKKKGLIWLGLMVAFIALLNVSQWLFFETYSAIPLSNCYFDWIIEHGLFGHEVVPLVFPDIIFNYIDIFTLSCNGLFWFGIYCIFLGLLYSVFLSLSKRRKNFVQIITIAIAVICFAILVFPVHCLVYYIISIMALAMLFVIINDRYKALPYIVVFLMIVVFAFFTRYRWIKHIDISGIETVWWFWCDYFAYKQFPKYSLQLFSSIPVVALLVVMIVRKVKAKKVAKTM